MTSANDQKPKRHHGFGTAAASTTAAAAASTAAAASAFPAPAAPSLAVALLLELLRRVLAVGPPHVLDVASGAVCVLATGCARVRFEAFATLVDGRAPAVALPLIHT
eukprot:CAMPEP_0182529934 /NCGR_PEP_ID=MMETSP1323-20130603/5540_1 /TAXON_ID=236787 /ORGANISM="Florenciella parvula, Strain RCC1693" /LENGTH=106 /DNA_ID=CAMNT_0024739183 /DNA_START=157 /DNA_END=477 /DNA_ORIENTATION=+